MESSLLEATKGLLATRRQTLEEISDESGVGIHWLRKFACGHITNPTVNNLQQLYDYLSGQSHRAQG